MDKHSKANIKKIRIDVGHYEYPVFIGKSILETLKNRVIDYDKILIITNKTLSSIYGEKLLEMTKGMDNIFVYRIPDGEEYKNTDTAQIIYEYMYDNNFSQKSCILSLGGGVVCDFAGYVATTYKGGISFIQIPTSFAAQLDTNLVENVALNHPKVKNLISVSSHPKAVIIDIDFLKTLPVAEYRKGLKRAIKYSIIFYNNGDKKFFNFLVNNKNELLSMDHDKIKEVLEEAIRVRKYLYSNDRLNIRFEDVLEHENTKVMNEVYDLLDDYGIDPESVGIEEDILKPKPKDTVVQDTEIIEKKAAIDIGTNSVRLLIGEVSTVGNKKKLLRELERRVEIVKLGEDVNKNHFLKEEAMERTLKVLSEYKKIIDHYHVDSLRVFATSAVRDSSNKEEFFEKAKKIPLDIECISGKEEGKLNFLGNSYIFDDKILVVDIGGGSTEFSLGQKNKIEIIKSIDVGCVRGTEKFLESGYTEDNIIDLYHWAKVKLDMLSDIESFKKDDYKIVAVAGTATTQISVREKMKEYDTKKVHLSKITLSELQENLETFLERNRGKADPIVGLDPKREDIIAAGTIILITILKLLVKDVVIVSEGDNLVGALIE